jgi:multidrug efflux pump subunit AcrA (membrane-fusion protein)
MKMEHTIFSNSAGKVKKIFYKEGDLIESEVLLVEIEEINKLVESRKVVKTGKKKC